MRTLVTGATGFVGAHTAVALERAGHDIRLLVRSRDKAARMAAATGLHTDDVAVGDVTDAPSVRRALQGCDAVFHAAAATSLVAGQAEHTRRISVAGAHNVLAAAATAGVGRIVHVSSTSALAVQDGRPLTVDSPVATSGAYGQAKGAAETIARELQAGGAPVQIVYPGGVLGPAAGDALGEASAGVVQFAAAGFLPSPTGSLSFVDVRDLAEVHVRLLEAAAPPARVMAGGLRIPMPEMAALLRRLTGRRFPVLPIPGRVLLGIGRLADRLGRVLPVTLPISEEALAVSVLWPGTVDDVDALGVRWRPLEETFRDTIRGWVRTGVLPAAKAGPLATGDGDP